MVKVRSTWRPWEGGWGAWGTAARLALRTRRCGGREGPIGGQRPAVTARAADCAAARGGAHRPQARLRPQAPTPHREDERPVVSRHQQRVPGRQDAGAQQEVAGVREAAILSLQAAPRCACAVGQAAPHAQAKPRSVAPSDAASASHYRPRGRCQ
jgi:hypothetical protein